jgi:SAM-dependent methyltransferase
MMRMRVSLLVAVGLALAAVGGVRAAADQAIESLRQDAAALVPLMHSELARQFLAACSSLPAPPSRVVFHDTTHGEYLSQREAAARPESLRSRLEPDSLEGLYFYQTRYGSILNYARVFEVLGAGGMTTFDGQRVLDFGYGRIGHLHALASLGANAVGVDIDPLLGALYSEPGDQGETRGKDERIGRVSIVTGWFPGDSAIRAAVGTGYDLVISKNTLKGGRSPAERSRQRRVIDLGVSDSVFVRAIAECLKPGGLFLMYTISGPKGNPRCPFSEAVLREAGFELLAYDRDDSPGAQAMTAALHHGRQSEDAPDSALTALYTLARRATVGGVR